MSFADYYLCDNCGEKTFYDAGMDYDHVGKMIVLCKECIKTHSIRFIPKPIYITPSDPVWPEIVTIGVPATHYCPKHSQTSVCGIFEPKKYTDKTYSVNCTNCTRTEKFQQDEKENWNEKP